MIDAFEKCPSPMSGILVEHFHGAAARIGVSDTAFPLRSAGYNLLVLSQWMNETDSERCINWARESYSAMQPFVGLGRYSPTWTTTKQAIRPRRRTARISEGFRKSRPNTTPRISFT
jgi:hypothetical protein